MSESLFLNQHIQNFSLSHPQEEGWKVYEFYEGPVHNYSFHCLPEFLRDCHPAVVTRRVTIKTIAMDELIGTSAYIHPAEAGSEWDVRHELDGSEWSGLLHIEWMGHPIHILSFFIYTGHGYSKVLHVATKSNVAIRGLTQDLHTYALSKRKVEARTIRVINGADIPITPVLWENIVLSHGLAEAIRRNVAAFFESEDRYRGLGIPYRRGLLFAGPPGCGKTVTLKALAYHSPAQVVTVLGKSDVEDRDIEAALHFAGTHAPSILFFEDLDKLVQSEKISLSHFLNLLDGFKSLNGVLIIATANEPEQLDPALLYRPSRFDRVWTFPLPDKDQRLTLLQKRGSSYFSEAVLENVAERSKGFSMAYVQEILVNALLESAHRGADPSDSTCCLAWRRCASSGDMPAPKAGRSSKESL